MLCYNNYIIPKAINNSIAKPSNESFIRMPYQQNSIQQKATKKVYS